jgi:ATP-binding cassette subfamily C protein
MALDAAGAFAGASKSVRMIVQSGILGFGAYLLMRADISAGAMMAASILMSRALAPIEAASMHWRNLVTTRQSYRRLYALFEALEAEQARSHSVRVSWGVSTGCFVSPTASAGQSGAETTC